MELIRFGDFEVDVRAGELRRSGGSRIKLQQQPFRVLVLLLEHAGEVVTREELRQAIWPAGTYVEFNLGLDTAIYRLRTALGDSAETPRFLETLPRRGYRFIAPVDRTVPSPALPALPAPPATPQPRPLARQVLYIIGILALVMGGYGLLSWHGSPAGLSTASGHSIAVLPFVNLSGDKNDEYFSDGIAEELSTALHKVPQLRVVGRASALAIRARNLSDREVGATLSADVLLEGTVRRSRDRVRVTVQLVNAASGYQIWSNEYERHVNDVFGAEDEISRAVVRSLQVTLAGSTEGPLVPRTVSSEAHDLYLKGRYFFGRRAEPGMLQRSVSYFQAATRVDSLYAAAYSGLSDAYSVLSIWAYMRPREGFPRAKAAARRALQLDSTIAEAHTSLGIVSVFYDWDWPTAERELRRAIALDPQYAQAYLFHAWYFVSRDSAAEAVMEVQHALDLDPLSAILATRAGTMLLFARRYDDATAQLHKALELDSTNALAHAELAKAAVLQGRCRDALAAIRRIPAAFPNVEGGVAGYAYASCGNHARARQIVADWERRGRHEYVHPSRIAQVYAVLADTENTLAWLGRAVRERDPYAPFALNADPLFDWLRGDLRFARLLQNAGP